MQGGIENNEIEAVIRKRQRFERCVHTLKWSRIAAEKIGRRAEAVNIVIADIESNGAMSMQRNPVTQPAIARAEIENIQSLGRRTRLQDSAHENVICSGAYFPLSGERPFVQIRKRSQLLAADCPSLMGTVLCVFPVKVCSGDVHGAEAVVR
jgi:hypothetical protein